MKVLALVTDAFGGYGGIAQYNRDLVAALSASPEVEAVHVLPRMGAVHCSGDLPSKVTVNRARPGPVTYSVEAARAARGMGPRDVVFCGHLFHAPLAAALSRAFGVRFWAQAHGIEAWERPSQFLRQAVERAALVTTVSRFTRARLLGWSEVSPDRVRVLPNTVRMLFSPGAIHPETLAKYGLVGAEIVLTVSRLSKTEAYKGHDRVIGAMATVRRAQPTAVYVIVGDGDARGELEELSRRKGLADSVRFLGRLSDEEVLTLYRSAAAFIMPSTGEGFGIAFVEAAATGLAVIGGNRDGTADALADGAIGLLINPLSHEEIVEALVEALNQRVLHSAEAAERFAFANFADHVDALVRQLVN
jgi:phosphatidylinositol alpha-1,6-mannosyltransferase